MTEVARVEVDWADRDLRALDAVSAEILVGSLFEDERPPRGVAGLVDWRLRGWLSQRCIDGFLVGARSELFLAPGRPRLMFDKILLVGVGPRAAFDETAFEQALARTLDALDGLGVRRAVVDLPGRHLGVVSPPRAIELLDAALRARPSSVEAVTVVDDRETQRVIEALRTTPARRNPAARR